MRKLLLSLLALSACVSAPGPGYSVQPSGLVTRDRIVLDLDLAREGEACKIVSQCVPGLDCIGGRCRP